MALEQKQNLGQPSNRKDGTPVWTGRSDEDKTIYARYARREIGMIDRQTKPGEYIPPAFPTGIITDDKGIIIGGSNGMSLRDYFASQALTGAQIWDAVLNGREASQFSGGVNKLAEVAYAVADAMLKERSK